MTTDNNYKLRLLNESSASEDLFEDQTHRQIANTLYDVIQYGSNEGLTIGLEGGWGSGKSTVVSILKNKLESESNTICFYFDAWAHEGDPLRRVFLEALIDQVGHDDKELQEIKSRVSNRKKTSNITSSQTVTKLGKWLALAALFVPLGAAIISDTASKIDLQWSDTFHWVFIFGFLCVLAPLFVLVRNGWNLWRCSKKLADMNNWMFLQGESESIVTQEVSEDDERSSIEFERYFSEIIDVIFSKKTDAKLLIVVDNLDRVDADDSLKIWSTLQTFLQRKNPTSYSASGFKKIWVLVPYDEDGLAKLWKNRSNGQNNTTDSNIEPNTRSISHNKDCAKSFFDKCFQLRIEVPKLILTGWEKFCTENINEALINWNDKDKEDVINVLKWTRESVADIPTPREIKTFVNQVGLLRLHCDKDISTIAIAYFSVQKYMKFQTNNEIEALLLSANLPLQSHKPFFDDGLTADLCGILFGVSSNKGQQLLLEPKIELALNTKNIEEIHSLSEAHKNAFWTVLNLHLTHMSDINKMARYSYTIWNGLWKTAPNNCKEFINYLMANADTLKSLDLPSQADLDGYLAVFSLLDEGGFNFTKIWKYLLQSLIEQMKKPDFDFSIGNKTIMALAACQNKKPPLQQSIGTIPIDIWMKWSTACISEETDSYAFVKPQKAILKEISSKIVAGTAIPEKLHDLISYLVNGGEVQWEQVITAIQGHIEWNQGSPSGNVFSVELYQILSTLFVSGHKIRKAIEPILKSGAFYNLTYNLTAQGAEKYAALLFAKCLPKELDSIQIPVVGSSAEGLQLIRSFWKTSNDINAQFVWNELTSESDFGFIWELAKNKSNLLVSDLIKYAVNMKHNKFFNYPNQLQLLEYSIIITSNNSEMNQKLTNSFISLGQIEKEIIEATNLDIIRYSQELNLVVENSTNNTIAEHLNGFIKVVVKDQWDKALAEDSYLTSLAINLNYKTKQVHISDNIYESLLTYLQSWIEKKIEPSDAQKEELPILITMLSSNFKTQLKNRLANCIVDNSFQCSVDATATLIEFVNIDKIISDGKDKLQNSLEDSIHKSDFESISIIDLILSHKDSDNFKPDTHLSEVFQSPMKHLLDNGDGTNTAVLERLATKFGVDLTKQQTEEGNSESAVADNANS